MTLFLSRSEVAELLPMTACIDAVEAAFAAHAEGSTIAPGVLSAHLPGGGFHVKTAGVTAPRPYFAAKVNANFPENPRRLGLPTIQGALVLFDATNGAVLAIMDSAEITRLRTAAATAVAAKFLSRRDSTVMTICGCGVQGRVHLEALRAVRDIDAVFAFDTDAEAATAFATEMSAVTGLDVKVASSLRSATMASDIVVTCTSSQEAFLGSSDIRRGTFVAAVGADWEQKQEIETELLAKACVVVDILEQCAAIGDLHHALEAGVMMRDDVYADLAAVVSGRTGCPANDRTIVFDSTGTALEDVAAAAWAYERAQASGRGRQFDLTG